LNFIGHYTVENYLNKLNNELFMKLETSEYQGILIGQIIVGFLGGLLLLLDDFAGWYHAGYRYEEWGDIYFGSGILASIFLFSMTLLLFNVAYSAVKIIKVKKIDSKELKTHCANSKRNGIIVAAICFVAGVIFVVSNIIDETEEWWLDTGFFAGIIGGIALVLLARLILSKIKTQ
jgi:hypothetical protein